MIRNIVFDIGNVLAGFYWREKLGALFPEDGELAQRVGKATVEGPYWGENDRGVYSEAEIVELCVSHDREIEAAIRLFFAHRNEVVTEYPYTAAWLKQYRQKGYRIFLLSNYSEGAYRYLAERSSFPKLADGAVISYEIKHIKPEPEIYRTLFARYQLLPAECVFLDDVKENVEGARAQGMQAIQVLNHEQAEADLQALLELDKSE